jgi:acetoin utilization protein AcuB
MMVMNVSEVMTRNPLTIEPEAAVGTAIAVMAKDRVRHLPVVDAEGRLVGVVTDRDLRGAAMVPEMAQYLSATARRRLVDIGARLEDLRVKDVMTWNPVTTSPDTSLTQAAALMFERRIGSLPVLEKGHVVGIVTDRDALKALAGKLPTLGGVDPAFLW